MERRKTRDGWGAYIPTPPLAARAATLPFGEGQSPEIFFEHAPVDRGECLEVRDRDPLVDLMRGPADEPELHHRTIVLDEPGVGRTARGGTCRFMPGDLGDRARDQIDERPRLSQEHVGIRRLELQPPA